VLALALASPSRAEDRSGGTMVTTESLTTSDDDYPRIHLAASGVVDAVSQQVGAEQTASYGVARSVDIGMGVSLGQSIGLFGLAQLHPQWASGSLFRPFVQLRGELHIASGGFGGGAWGGVLMELGPGRLKAGPAGLIFTPRAGYHQYAAMGLVGYELDLLRPATSTVERTERVVVREVERSTEPAPKPRPAVAATATLTGRLLDADGKPVNGIIRVPALDRTYEASPEFDIDLPPGAHLVEADAGGYLVRGRRFEVVEQSPAGSTSSAGTGQANRGLFRLETGEKTIYDFVLRPVPKVKTARLMPSEVTISEQIQFAFGKSEIPEQSFFILDEVADILLHHPEIKRILIEGHTDDIGSDEYNQKLSKDRAGAVLSYLLEHGMEANRMRAEGFGRTRPLARSGTAADRAKNRRVQFRIVESAGAEDRAELAGPEHHGG
jgi:outer membrane protein OmpA-like peptidoglycan-associated protein